MAGRRGDEEQGGRRRRRKGRLDCPDGQWRGVVVQDEIWPVRQGGLYSVPPMRLEFSDPGGTRQHQKHRRDLKRSELEKHWILRMK